MGERDKRALKIAGAALALFLVLRFGVFPIWDRWGEAGANLPLRERTLAKYREAVQTVGLRSAETVSLEARLREAEAGLLTSETTALASAELQDLVKQLTSAQSIDVRTSEFLTVKPLGGNYLQVPLGLQFQCRLDQLVNFLNELQGGSKCLAVSRLLIQTTGAKEKLVSVNMTVAGIMRSAGTNKEKPE